MCLLSYGVQKQKQNARTATDVEPATDERVALRADQRDRPTIVVRQDDLLAHDGVEKDDEGDRVEKVRLAPHPRLCIICGIKLRLCARLGVEG